MRRDLWGSEVSPKEITINVYHDEREISNNWLYHSFLLIPILNEEDALNLLNETRQKTGWWKELHFKNLGNTRAETCLAVEWIDLFSQSLFEKLYFYFFGVNYQNLDRTWWNKSQRDFRIYNRFFQIGLYGAIKWFFLTVGFEKVTLQNIFSDKKSREGEDRFHTQPVEEIKMKSLFKGEDIVFEHPEIIEMDSDHEKEKSYPSKSHLLQFVDLIMGTFSQILDNTSSSKGKCMAADKCLRFKLPAKLMQLNINSRYYQRYAMSFFPARKLTKTEILEDNIAAKVNQFYNVREVKYINRSQLPLPLFSQRKQKIADRRRNERSYHISR